MSKDIISCLFITAVVAIALVAIALNFGLDNPKMGMALLAACVVMLFVSVILGIKIDEYKTSLVESIEELSKQEELSIRREMQKGIETDNKMRGLNQIIKAQSVEIKKLEEANKSLSDNF